MKRATARLSTAGACTLTAEGNSQSRQPRRSTIRESIISGESIKDIYTNCLRLGNQNKINQNNAWSVKLLDILDKVPAATDTKEPAKSSKKDKTPHPEEVCNFQVASNALDTSTKIYSYRVDSVHQHTYRVLSGLNRTSGKDDKESDESQPEGESQQEQTQKKSKPRKIVSLSHTLDTVANINTKTIDVVHNVDPLFHKTAEAFDDGGVYGLLLSQLGISVGCNIVFDSSEYRPEAIESTSEAYQPGSLHQFIQGWANTEICSDFHDFSFVWDQEVSRKSTARSFELPDFDVAEGSIFNTSFDDDDDDDDNEVYAQLELMTQQYLPPSQDLPDPTPEPQNFPDDNPMDDSQMSTPGFISEGDSLDSSAIVDLEMSQESSRFQEQMSQLSGSEQCDTLTNILVGPGNPSVDQVVKLLVDGTSEYNYFSSRLMENWAGPEYWKFKPTSNKPKTAKGTTTGKPRKKRSEFFLNFLEDDPTDYDEAFKILTGARGGCISKDALLNSSKPTTLPFVDLHFDIKRLTQLFCKPGKSLSFRANTGESHVPGSSNLPVPVPLDELPESLQMADQYDSDDGESGMGFVPPQPTEPTDFSIDDVPSDAGFSFSYSQEPSSQIAPVDLIDAPEAVREIRINYSKRAKNVDVEKLRNNIWTQLCADSQENQTPNAPKPVSNDISETKLFSEVLASLPEVVPAAQIPDLSVPLCFICLLDLANKKGLQIDQKPGDLSISKYVFSKVN